METTDFGKKSLEVAAKSPITIWRRINGNPNF